MAIPLLPYAPITQNARVERIRVGSDEDLKVVALDQSMDADNLKTVIEAAYRQIFFHAFKSDRDRFLESQLRNGQITVRDFIRGLCLSDTFTRTFYGFNSNYKVVRHLVEGGRQWTHNVVYTDVLTQTIGDQRHHDAHVDGRDLVTAEVLRQSQEHEEGGNGDEAHAEERV